VLTKRLGLGFVAVHVSNPFHQGFRGQVKWREEKRVVPLDKGETSRDELFLVVFVKLQGGLHRMIVTTAVVERVGENPQIYPFLAQGFGFRICPLIEPATDLIFPSALLDVFVRSVVDIDVGVQFVISAPDLLLGQFTLGIHQFVPSAAHAHEEDMDEGVVEPVKFDLKGCLFSDLAEMGELGKDVRSEDVFSTFGSVCSPDLGAISSLGTNRT
jgi:hypothetical protein